MNKIEFIKSNYSIRDLAVRFGAQPNQKGICKHNPLRAEKTSSLVIYDSTNTYNDFGGDGGDVIDFYMAFYSLDIGDTIESMLREIGKTGDDFIEMPIKQFAPIPEIKYTHPKDVLKAFNSEFQHSKINYKTHKNHLETIAPIWLFDEANEFDLIEFDDLCKYSKTEDTIIVLLPDENGEAKTFRYRYKTINDEKRKWVALSKTQSNYPYCRFKSEKLTLIVEGTRDFLTALLCGYSVIALPSAKYKLSNELLKDRFCVFIDDDDGKKSMIELYENAICEKILFNHKAFKTITKCNSKDFSDYLYQFKNLQHFKDAFEKIIYSENIKEVDWENNINKIAKPVTRDVVQNAENAEWIFDDLILKGLITTIVGAPGVGKSAFSFGVANMLFQENKISKLLYFDSDNPISYVKDRILKLIDTFDEDKIKYYNGVNSNPKEMIQILEMLSNCKGGEKVLIVIDSLKFFIQGSMNEDKIVSPFYDLLKLIRDRFKATVLVLHHTRKSKDDEGKLTYNGSQVVESSTDNMLMLTKDFVYHKKSRSDKAGLKFNLEIKFEEMLIDVSDFKEDDILAVEDTKNYSNEIYNFLYNKHGFVNQKEIIDALNKTIPRRQIPEILWADEYKNTLWIVEKGDKKSWLFKAIPQSIINDEMELPECLL